MSLSTLNPEAESGQDSASLSDFLASTTCLKFWIGVFRLEKAIGPSLAVGCVCVCRVSIGLKAFKV